MSTVILRITFQTKTKQQERLAKVVLNSLLNMFSNLKIKLYMNTSRHNIGYWVDLRNRSSSREPDERS